MDSKNNLYSNGYVVTYEEGDQSLERVVVPLEKELEDKSYMIKQDDTLLSIAHFFYGESKPWWILADSNQDVIDNIFELIPGTEIIIPNAKKII